MQEPGGIMQDSGGRVQEAGYRIQKNEAVFLTGKDSN